MKGPIERWLDKPITKGTQDALVKVMLFVGIVMFVVIVGIVLVDLL